MAIQHGVQYLDQYQIQKGIQRITYSKNKNYKESLDLYKDIKWHLNIFFNKVLVNVDQSNIKANRLNILSLVREIFSEYADFSIIDLGNENK